METGQDGTHSGEPAKVAAQEPKTRVRRARRASSNALPVDAPPAVAVSLTSNRKAPPAAMGTGRQTAFYSTTAGLIMLIVALVVVFVQPEPKPIQAMVFIVWIGLAAALVMNGFLTITIQITTKWIKASGAGAAFIFVCLFAAKIAVPGFGGLASLFVGQ